MPASTAQDIPWISKICLVACLLACLFVCLSLCICDTLRDLVPFVQFQKREKHPWRNVTFSKVSGLKVTLIHGVFRVLKLYKWYQTAQRISFKINTSLNS